MTSLRSPLLNPAVRAEARPGSIREPKKSVEIQNLKLSRDDGKEKAAGKYQRAKKER